MDPKFFEYLQKGQINKVASIYSSPGDDVIAEVPKYGKKALETFIFVYDQTWILDKLAQELVKQYQPDFQESLTQIVQKLDPTKRQNLLKTIGLYRKSTELAWLLPILNTYNVPDVPIYQSQTVPQTGLQPFEIQPIPKPVDPMALLIEALDNENLTQINELVQTGIFKRPDLTKPIFTQALYKKIRPKYEGGELETAEWVRWLVRNGA